MASPDKIVFTRGVPPPEALKSKALEECFASALEKYSPAILQYGQASGHTRLREQLADQYKVSSDEIIVSNGSLQLLDLLAATVVSQGSLVFTEQPTYDRALVTFRNRGAEVVGIESDGMGIIPEAIITAITASRAPVCLYLIPDFQNPTGITMPAQRRREVLELADRFGFLVIEDIPYRSLRYTGEDVPLMREINPDKVITVSSFSKLISPGLRVGYGIAPKKLIAELTQRAENTYLSPVLPTQAAVSEFIEGGHMPAHLEYLKSLYAPRCQAMIEAVEKFIPEAQVFRPEGGFFLGLWLPQEARTTDLLARAAAVGLVLTDGAAFYAGSQGGEVSRYAARFIRLPFCAVTPAEINEGVARLAKLV